MGWLGPAFIRLSISFLERTAKSCYEPTVIVRETPIMVQPWEVRATGRKAAMISAPEQVAEAYNSRGVYISRHRLSRALSSLARLFTIFLTPPYSFFLCLKFTSRHTRQTFSSEHHSILHHALNNTSYSVPQRSRCLGSSSSISKWGLASCEFAQSHSLVFLVRDS